MHSEVTYFFQQLMNGLSVGSIYSMIAVGYSMVYSLLFLVNFAHGDLYVFGTFIAWSLALTGMPILACIVLAGIGTGLIGMTIERTIYRPVRSANRIVPMISALGAALILRTLAQVLWGVRAAFLPLLCPLGLCGDRRRANLLPADCCAGCGCGDCNSLY